jgi:hypothetical protein
LGLTGSGGRFVGFGGGIRVGRSSRLLRPEYPAAFGDALVGAD